LKKNKVNFYLTDQKFGKVPLEEGLPKVFFKDLNFEKYAEFTMNFPILFIQHEDRYISGRKYIFKDFMEGKIDEIGNRLPTENDLTTHLSTIFTENRLKKYIELRSMDTCGWDCLCAGPAFNIGLLYGKFR
jgi:glutamate--cysteine ligase